MSPTGFKTFLATTLPRARDGCSIGMGVAMLTLYG
jgi:hypothetical protein